MRAHVAYLRARPDAGAAPIHDSRRIHGDISADTSTSWITSLVTDRYRFCKQNIKSEITFSDSIVLKYLYALNIRVEVKELFHKMIFFPTWHDKRGELCALKSGSKNDFSQNIVKLTMQFCRKLFLRVIDHVTSIYIKRDCFCSRGNDLPPRDPPAATLLPGRS